MKMALSNTPPSAGRCSVAVLSLASYRQAKEADPYTFKKDGGFFIREGAGEVKKMPPRQK